MSEHITKLAISNYRSLLNVVIPMGTLNVITGANGCGKSNLYRALRLLAETAQDGVVKALANEGGLASTYWAGPEKLSKGMMAGTQPVQGGALKKRKRMRLGFAGEMFGYSISLGLPAMAQPPASAFFRDPEIKREVIWNGAKFSSPATLVDRKGSIAQARCVHGWQKLNENLQPFDSMLAQVADPTFAPETMLLRESIRNWRFYDYLRTDRDAPARRPHVGTRTMALHHDGSDLAAAIQTILEIGDAEGLHETIATAFPGGRLGVEIRDDGFFDVNFSQHGLLRPLKGAELSDGTLRFLMFAAALFTPRPPTLMVLNEPETSLHPDLLSALARLIVHAAESTQLWIITHSEALARTIGEQSECRPLRLEKKCGQTVIAGQNLLDVPTWRWPDKV